MTALPELPSGVWQHWKGPLYLVFGYGHDANDEQRTTVHYLALQLDGAHAGPRLATRTALSQDVEVDAFFDMVHILDGTKCTAPLECREGALRGRHTRRFKYLGPTWEPKEVPQ